MRNLKNLVAGLAATAIVAPLAGANASTIFFDSFESPTVNSWAVFQDNVGDNGTWSTMSGTGIEIQSSGTVSGVTAYDGNQYVELDSHATSSRFSSYYSKKKKSHGGHYGGSSSTDTNSMMATVVAFQEGESYKIDFAYLPRTDNDCGDDNGIALMLGTLENGTFSLVETLLEVSETTSSQSDWSVYSVVFTAMADVNAIAFSAFGKDNSLGGFIDAVSIEHLSAVPVPAAGILLATGLAAAGGLRSRKKAKA